MEERVLLTLSSHPSQSILTLSSTVCSCFLFFVLFSWPWPPFPPSSPDRYSKVPPMAAHKGDGRLTPSHYKEPNTTTGKAALKSYTEHREACLRKKRPKLGGHLCALWPQAVKLATKPWAVTGGQSFGKGPCTLFSSQRFCVDVMRTS